MKFIDFLNEGKKFVYRNKQFKTKVFFAEEENHTFDSRLERSDLTLFEFRKEIDKLIEKLQDKEYGLYGVKFKDFGLICRYKPKELFIITILSKEMIIRNVDFKMSILEWLESSNNTKVELNEFRIFNVDSKELYVENKENDLHIYGQDFHILED